MLKITWNTYPYRRDLRWLWCSFDYEQKAYIWKETEILCYFIADHWLQSCEIDDIELWEEFEVKQKNIRAGQRAEKYRNKASKFNKKAWESELSKHESDFLSLAEPVKIWHHSEWRHRKLLEKSRKKMDKKIENWNKADEMNDKAEYWEDQKYFTKAEKQAKKERLKLVRDKAEEIRRNYYKVWDEYKWWHTSWRIIKINKKTVKLDWWSKREIAYSQDFDKYLKKAKEIL